MHELAQRLRSDVDDRPTTRTYRDHLIADGLSLPQPPFGGRRTVAWAPAGDYIAVVSAGAKGFRNVYLVPATGGAPRQVSYLANADSTAPAWTPDGSSILFGSGQRTEDTNLARVDLKPRTPTFRTDQFSDLFRQRPSRQTPEPSTPRQPTSDDDAGAGPATTPTTAPLTSLFPTPAPTTGPATRPNHTEVVFDDIDERLALLPVGLDVDEVTVSPDGKWAGVIGAAGGRTNVYLYPLDPLVESPVARQMTATADGKSDLQFAAEPGGGGTRLYFREGGRPRYVAVPFRTSGGGTGSALRPATCRCRSRWTPASTATSASPSTRPGGTWPTSSTTPPCTAWTGRPSAPASPRTWTPPAPPPTSGACSRL